MVKAEVPTEVPPRVLHKAKKGQKLTEEQKAENKAIKKAEFMTSPKGLRWLNNKWIDELSALLSQCKTIEDKDKVLEDYKSRGIKQEQFINSMIDKYEPSSSTYVVSPWLANWAKDNSILAQSWTLENPLRANEIEESLKTVMPEEEFDYKGPYFKT